MHYDNLTVEQFQEAKVTDEFRNYIKDYISEKEIVAHFIKKDGTLRIMKCTRNMSKIPTDKHPKGKSEETTSASDTLQVFDVELNEWRAFKPSTLTFVEWR